MNDALLIAIAAFVGAMVSVIPAMATAFDAKVLTSTIVKAVIAAVGFAAAYNYSGVPVNLIALMSAFLAGAGFNLGVAQVGAAYQAKRTGQKN